MVDISSRLPHTRATRTIALAQPRVRDVGRILLMYIGPDDALVTMDLDFDHGTAAADAADPRKKDVIALVEDDFRAELATTRASVEAASVSPLRLAEHLRAGGVPLVLISLWRLHGEKDPHWVVVTGFDGQVFRILDPIAPPPSGGDPGISISVDEFKRITRYGRRRQSKRQFFHRSDWGCPLASRFRLFEDVGCLHVERPLRSLRVIEEVAGRLAETSR